MNQLDLKQLALDRNPGSGQSNSQRRPRKWVTRYVIPVGILIGFLSLLGAAAGDRLRPARSVTVLPVIVSEAEIRRSGEPLFQAAGWIEPRPTSVSVASLAPGVVEELLVVEGAQVEADQPVARLVDVDARLAVREAKAALAIRRAELNQAEAEFRAAKKRRENPLHLQAALAEAESALSRVESQLAQLPHSIESAKARVDYTEQNWKGKRAAKNAISGRSLQQAQSEHLAAAAELRNLRDREPNLRREAESLRRRVDALRGQLDLLIDEKRAEQEAEAKVAAATALVDEAKLALEGAELTLQRCVIRAPFSGRVLRLVAAPGSRMMGLDPEAGQSSSTVVKMYDPDRLQVRADVRLEDVPRVIPGQSVRIETASSSQPIDGRVLLPTSSANVQKNTLEVKVQLLDPPETVRPEMLVTATFLAPEVSGDEIAESESVERILIPKRLVQAGSSGSTVWVVGSGHRAARRSVKLGGEVEAGGATDGRLVEVTSGLAVTDKLIVSGTEQLQPGDRVTISGEDRSIGVRG